MNTEIKKKIVKIYLEFIERIDQVYGLYFDTLYSYKLLVKEFNKTRELTKSSLKEISPNQATDEYLDTAWMMYGDGNPNEGIPKVHHKTTQGEFYKRISDKGLNIKYIGNIILILIYQYWEDVYRPKISKILNIKKSDLKSDLFGDIRLIRNSIIHHNAIAKPEIKNCKFLKWFNPGDEIYIDNEKLLIIREELKKLKFTHSN